MKRICFIIPYFGKFNNYFNIFLKSCETNASLCDWLIFTDDKTKYNYPDNVHVNYISWDDMKRFIQGKFDFEVSLNRPYKLCDFKVAYGYLFSEYLNDYEFWGHCDTDLIWGKIEDFLKDDILNNYDKIFNLGHCTIFRNTYENNRRFMSNVLGERYKEVFSAKENMSFDEEYNKSINNIFEELNVKVFEDSFAANLYTKTSDFKLTSLGKNRKYTTERKSKNMFVWHNGCLTRYIVLKGEIIKKDYLYLHMQSRSMKINILVNDDLKEFKIIPNSFDTLEIKSDNLTNQTIKHIKAKHINFHYFILRSKNFKVKLRRRFGKI